MRTTTWRDCNRPSATADNRESKYSSRRKFRNESGNRGGAHCVHRKRYWIYARITIARWKRPEETSRHLETSASPTLLLHSKRAKWATKFRVSNHSLNSEMLTPTSREVCRYTSGFEGELGSRERRN